MIDPKKLTENLTKAVKNVLEAQSVSVYNGMANLQADLKERIFLNGISTDGQSIGKYSTRPYYASLRPNSQVRSSSLKPRGKNSNKGKFANGKPRKTMYLPGGYAEYRSVVGRQNAKVDLNLTGSLQKDIRLGGSDNKLILAFTTEEQKEIASGNETRFGKTIFSASKPELDALVENWRDQVSEAFFNSFK